MELGRATSEKNLIKALTMVFNLIFLRGIASGNLVDTLMIVRRYWWTNAINNNVAEGFLNCWYWL